MKEFTFTTPDGPTTMPAGLMRTMFPLASSLPLIRLCVPPFTRLSAMLELFGWINFVVSPWAIEKECQSRIAIPDAWLMVT